MEDELLVRREGWEIDVFVTATDNGVFTESYNLFWLVFRLTICMSKFLRFAVAFLYFLSCECETGPKNWTIIVIENIANSGFRCSTCKSCVCLLSRLVLVLNDTYGLAWIIHQLPHVSLWANNRSLNLSSLLLSMISSDDKDHGISGPQHSIHKRYRNFHVNDFAIKTLWVFFLFRYTVFPY